MPMAAITTFLALRNAATTSGERTSYSPCISVTLVDMPINPRERETEMSEILLLNSGVDLCAPLINEEFEENKKPQDFIV